MKKVGMLLLVSIFTILARVEESQAFYNYYFMKKALWCEARAQECIAAGDYQCKVYYYYGCGRA